MAVPSLELGHVSTVKMLEMLNHINHTWHKKMYKNTIFRDISQDPLIPWVAVIKTDAVHNTEVGKAVLEERVKIKVHIFFYIL